MTYTTPARLGWLAGFIDGEGTVSLVQSNDKHWHRPYIRPLVQIANTDRRGLRRAARIIEAITGKRPGRFIRTTSERSEREFGQKRGYRLAVHTQWELELLLTRLLPLFVLKRTQAEIVLAFCRLVRGRAVPGRRGYDAETKRREVELYLASLRANRRGRQMDDRIAELEAMLSTVGWSHELNRRDSNASDGERIIRGPVEMGPRLGNRAPERAPNRETPRPGNSEVTGIAGTVESGGGSSLEITKDEGALRTAEESAEAAEKSARQS